MARVLWVEDNRVTAEMVAVRLENAGHEVFRAADGRAALEQVGPAEPDVILLDLMMPELDGLQVLQILKRDPLLGAIPVVVLSARAQERDALQALACGAADYITKPFSFAELLARLERTLAEGPEPLRITVRDEDDALFVGGLVHGDPSGVVARFHRDASPAFALGDAATVSLSSRVLPEPIELGVTVVRRAEEEGWRRFGFRMDERTRAAPGLTDAFLRVLGRRGMRRVELDGEPPVEVRVHDADSSEDLGLQGHLENVSAFGAGFFLKGNADRMLHARERVEIRFRLPGGAEELRLPASIRHRVLGEDGTHYGVRFGEGGSGKGGGNREERGGPTLEQQEEIADYIVARQSDAAAEPSPAPQPSTAPSRPASDAAPPDDASGD